MKTLQSLLPVSLSAASLWTGLVAATPLLSGSSSDLSVPRSEIRLQVTDLLPPLLPQSLAGPGPAGFTGGFPRAPAGTLPEPRPLALFGTGFLALAMVVHLRRRM